MAMFVDEPKLCNRGYKPWERNDAKTGAGRKKKDAQKRGGNTEEVNSSLDRHQVLQNHTRIQELEQRQEAYEELNLEERIEALEDNALALVALVEENARKKHARK